MSMSLFVAIWCIVSYVYTLPAGMLNFFCHSSALEGVPVTMPASRQLRVLSRAGAIWLVARLPRPHSATPSLRPGDWPNTALDARGAMAARAAVFVRKRRRAESVMFAVPGIEFDRREV